jgi:hypothetical protein
MKSENFSISPSIFENCYGLLRIRDRAAKAFSSEVDTGSRDRVIPGANKFATV